DFQLTERNAATVAAICTRLEGIPLAVELAAARALVLTPAQILAHLENRLDFLAGRSAATLRHRTLRTPIDWSYQLLAPELQQFFSSLSSFRGGWTLEAAEAVCSAPEGSKQNAEGTEEGSLLPTAFCLLPSALDCLEQLRDCSLLGAEEVGTQVRFR